MKTPIRFTPEKQQELISRYQFCERIVEFGWIPVPPEDLGEDFIVHIYFERKATGASFYVQEKSVVNLQERQKDEFLPYSFEVKDLKHWETFVQPVVLVIWDIKLREGRWAIWNGVNGVIKHTNKKRPNWRNQGKTLVYIPSNNATDDNGLVKLQHAIGSFMYPLVSKNKELSMKMSISLPDSPDGIEMAEALKKLYDAGDKATLKNGAIKSVEIPDWAKPWFDTNFVEITMESRGSPDPLPVDITIITTDGKTETLKGIELKVVKAGMRTTQLSNEHQAYPVKFEFIFSSSKECSAAVEISGLGSNVNVTRDILKFKQALSLGGKLQLFSLKHNSPLPIDIPVPTQPEFAPGPEFIQIVEYLCLIQAKTGKFFQLQSDVISQQDTQTIIELLTIIKNGKLRKKGKNLEKQFEVEPPTNIIDCFQQKKPISLTLTHDTSSGELLGQKIEMGKAIEQITGILDMTLSELETAIEIHKVEGQLHLRLIDVESVISFPDWTPKV
jgi:hypothetical protein